MEIRGGKRLKGQIDVGTAEQPLVSVITATYNGKSHLTQCVESVLRQDYPNIEHLVVDGGSSDGTVDVLREYDDRIALWTSGADLGVYDAWNKALREANGEWICFLGADDQFTGGAVSAYMGLAAKNPEAEYLSAQVQIVDDLGNERIFGERWRWPSFCRSMCTAHVGSMHRRRLFERLGLYDVNYHIAGDYEFLLRPRGRLRAAYMPRITVVMRAGGLSCTYEAIEETARAQIATGGRGKVFALVSMYTASLRYKSDCWVHEVLNRVAEQRDR